MDEGEVMQNIAMVSSLGFGQPILDGPNCEKMAWRSVQSRRLFRAVLAASTSLCIAGAAPAVAQERSAANEAENTSLSDIVVTARKRAENLRDVPVAITAITGETLQQKNITQLIDLPLITPNFSFSYGSVLPFTFIRGFGSGSNASFEQSVGKFIDNVSYGRDQDGRIPIFDVERVEVLKGPQVLTFGNSATAGAINITTKKPGDTFEANGSIGYEFEGREINSQFGVTIPLMEGASFRLAGFYQDLARGSYYNPNKGRHEVNVRNIAVRPSLRLQPVDGLEILLRAEVDRLKNFGNAIVPIAQPLLPNRLPYPVVGDRKRRYVNTNVAPYFSDEPNDLDAELYQIDMNYGIFGGTLSSTTAWRDTNGAAMGATEGFQHQPTFFTAIWQQYQQFSQEVRFNGTYGALDVTVGGYYQRDTLAADTIQEFTLGGFGLTGAAATPFGRTWTYDQKSRTYSGFVDLTYRVTDRLSVSGGVRYSNTRKLAGGSVIGIGIIPNLRTDTTRAERQAARNPSLDPIYRAILGTGQHNYPLGTMKRTDDHWQPQAIIQYEIAPKNKAYFKFVRGAKVGGYDFLYNVLPANPQPDRGYDPEIATMFEAGIKGQVLDNKLDYAVAVFRETFNGLQASVYSPARSGFLVSNVGKARSQGIEVELNYRPTPELRITANGSYLDAKYLEFKGTSCSSLQNAGLAPGCTGTPPLQDLSGAPTSYASKWNGYLSVDYVKPVGSGDRQIGVGASIFARTKYDAGTFNDPQMQQKAFAQLDAHIDFGASDSTWNLSLYGRNLTDYQPLDFGVIQPGSPTAVLGNYGRGRQIGVKLTFAMP
jgi:iron complex outermembrane receptor protein